MYLIRLTTYFVDPHGSPDFGGDQLYLSDELDCTPDMWYQYGEETTEEDLQGSEDGYNSTAEMYEAVEIGDEELDKIKKILKKYKKLNKLFDR